jgi:hypothetical protein
MKRLAVLKLYINADEYLLRQIVEIDDNDKVLKYYSINEELPLTEWYAASYKISEGKLIAYNINKQQ